MGTKELLKPRLKEYVETITSKSKGTDKYVCPLCGSGTGKHKTGAFSIQDETRWKCFSCGEGGDIFDLIGLVEGIDDPKDLFKRAEEIFNISSYKTNSYTLENVKSSFRPSADKNRTKEPKKDKEPLESYFKRCAEALDNEYISYRGISRETAEKYNLGIDNHFKTKEGDKYTEWKALIIPTGPNSFMARNTDINNKDERVRKNGTAIPFNWECLKTSNNPIYIVEGEIDALSIIEAGGEAIGIGGTSGTNQLVKKYLLENPPKAPLILALDNDDEGRNKEAQLAEVLKEMDIEFIQYSPNETIGDYKDANEALTADREGLVRAILIGYEVCQTALNEQREAIRAEYIKTSAKYHINEFLEGVAASVETAFIPTGFKQLDYYLDGGLFEGLYGIGAISSLGKTTFILQVADQIAQNGQDVLIFSLEMARAEIMAKSISRNTAQIVEAEKLDSKLAKTARGITTGKFYKSYSAEDKGIINKAVNAYAQYADHLFIYEGVGDLGPKEVKNIVDHHCKVTGNRPVVIVDYLQILAPTDIRATDKQNTDKAVLELKRLSRDYKIPVIAISSLNRANYSSKISMEAFKESGAIEYSTDVLIGLQLKGVGEKDFNVDEAKSRTPREVELIILKNRNGRTGSTIDLNYYPMFNLFDEWTAAEW